MADEFSIILLYCSFGEAVTELLATINSFLFQNDLKPKKVYHFANHLSAIYAL